MLPTKKSLSYGILLNIIKKNYHRGKIFEENIDKINVLESSISQYRNLSSKSKWIQDLDLNLEIKGKLKNFIEDYEKLYESDIEIVAKNIKNDLDAHPKRSFFGLLIRILPKHYSKLKKIDKLKKQTLKELISN